MDREQLKHHLLTFTEKEILVDILLELKILNKKLSDHSLIKLDLNEDVYERGDEI